MNKDFTVRFTEYIREQYPGSRAPFSGFTEEEISVLRQKQRVSHLPAIYHDYLRLIGRNQGNFLFAGAATTYIQLQNFKRHLEQVIEDIGSPLKLPENAFVFLSYQTVDFFFFLCVPQKNDPEVYYYKEGKEKFLVVSESLSSWFLEQSLDPLLFPSLYFIGNNKGDDGEIPF